MTRLRACVVCYTPFAGAGSRCPTHTLPKRTGTYTRNARTVATAGSRCHLCGEGPRPGDPFVADHVVPRSLGGSDSITNLSPAHRSCNGRRGAQVKTELDWRQRQR